MSAQSPAASGDDDHARARSGVGVGAAGAGDLTWAAASVDLEPAASVDLAAAASVDLEPAPPTKPVGSKHSVDPAGPAVLDAPMTAAESRQSTAEPGSSAVPGPVGSAEPHLSSASAEVSVPAASSARHLFPALLIYTLLRLVLIAVLTVVLSMFMVWLVALVFAVVLQMPLAWLLFGAQRRTVNQAMAAAGAKRRAEREALHRALAGDD